jgi:hypothetical protein
MTSCKFSMNPLVASRRSRAVAVLYVLLVVLVSLSEDNGEREEGKRNDDKRREGRVVEGKTERWESGKERRADLTGTHAINTLPSTTIVRSTRCAFSSLSTSTTLRAISACVDDLNGILSVLSSGYDQSSEIAGSRNGRGKGREDTGKRTSRAIPLGLIPAMTSCSEVYSVVVGR